MIADLAHLHVGDCMRVGVFTCSPDATLTQVAAAMADRRVHAIAVKDPADPGKLRIVSDDDVVAAMADGRIPRAIDVASATPLTVPADASVARAAQLMVQQNSRHLLVLDPANGHPVGVVSTLDLAAIYAEMGTAALAR